MRLPSTRLRVLMLLALSGVGVLVGVLVGAVAGARGLLAYAVVVAALVAFGAVRGRAALAPGARAPGDAAAGRTCTCCTTTHFDPVEIV